MKIYFVKFQVKTNLGQATEMAFRVNDIISMKDVGANISEVVMTHSNMQVYHSVGAILLKIKEAQKE